MGTVLTELFLRDYDLASGLYNQAVEETSVGLRPLDTQTGELPFFATLRRDGRLVRTSMYCDGGEIRIGDDSFRLSPDRHLPLDAL